jgi:hypothetical protein
MFEYRVLRGMFGSKREKVEGKNLIIRFFIFCTLHKILL